MAKKNCWEFKKCGREPGGYRVRQLGVCPATTDGRLDGVHDGRNSGRACWVVAGTLCRGEVQGSFAMKYLDCAKCDFYRLVKSEEGRDFVFSAKLIERLDGKVGTEAAGG